LHRKTVIAALACVTVGYLIMFVVVFDYSRWVSNWAVCMFLILHAVKMLPASRETPPLPSNDTRTTIFAAIITLIPRVGIVPPF
jgi:multisubunit Na+/H+ antiporter MnhE subunit